MIEIGTLIDRDPEIRGGRPKVAGTGLTVKRIAVCYRAGILAHVHAALAYYHANRDEVEADISLE
jgi:uncharacterized protein (DUF433 family)